MENTSTTKRRLESAFEDEQEQTNSSPLKSTENKSNKISKFGKLGLFFSIYLSIFILPNL